MAFFQFSSLISIFFEILKRKIKQEVDLFEQLSIGNVKQSNEIVLLTSIVIGQKSANQIAQYMVENWRDFLTLFADGQHGFRFTAKRILRRPSLGF